MIRRLIARLDNWSLSFDGDVVETTLVWQDGRQVAMFIPHHPTFLVKWFKDCWARAAVARIMADPTFDSFQPRVRNDGT